MAVTSLASAQDRTIIEERPAIRVPAPPSVTVEKSKPPVVEKRSIETTGKGGCDSKDRAQRGSGGIDDRKKRALRLSLTVATNRAA